jgi:hypothetical protein
MCRMKIRRSALVLSCCPLFFLAAQAPKQAAPPAGKVSLKIYSDSTNGVSFSYPADWKMSREPSFYLAPLIFYPQQSAQAIVFYGPSGTHLETNFAGLEFAYVARSEPDQVSCLQHVTKDIDPKERRLETVTINGTRFGTSTRPIAIEPAFSSKPPSTRSVLTPTTAEPNSPLPSQRLSRDLSTPSSKLSKSRPQNRSLARHAQLREQERIIERDLLQIVVPS